jgi:hypothetical protein
MSVGRLGPPNRWETLMKKLLLLLIVVALGVAVAKKVRDA